MHLFSMLELLAVRLRLLELHRVELRAVLHQELVAIPVLPELFERLHRRQALADARFVECAPYLRRRGARGVPRGRRGTPQY